MSSHSAVASAEHVAERLRPLLAPRSITLIGASSRPGRPGHNTLISIRRVGFDGPVYPVTPTSDEILGWECFPDVRDTPEAVDLAIIAGAAHRLEAQLNAAIDRGVRSAVIFANPSLDGVDDVRLRDRLTDIAANAGLPLLGPNSVGFLNYDAAAAGTWAMPATPEPGNVAIIAQSGLIMSEAVNNDPRRRLNLAVHSGQEATVSFADLVEYALQMPTTRAVGLYLEVIKDPEPFAAAVANALEKGIPLVMLRPGRTAQAQSQILTHSGRMAGSDAGYDALCRRFGVIRVDTPDEWYATLALLAHPVAPRAGALAGLVDSGGERALILDLAAELGVPLTNFETRTTARLQEVLTPNSLPENPPDIWDGQPDLEAHMAGCLEAVLDDPGTAAAFVFHDWAAEDTTMPTAMVSGCLGVAGSADKPIFAATYSSRQLYPRFMSELVDGGVPVVDGIRSALVAGRNMLRVRDFEKLDPTPPTVVPSNEVVDEWHHRLALARPLDEVGALALVSAFGVPVAQTVLCVDESEALQAARACGFPVVVKTGQEISHKSDVDGVHLNLRDEAAVTAAYRDLAERLGTRVVVAPMVEAGVEVALGIVQTGFGPVLVLAAGGTLVELVGDRTFLPAPASAAEIRRALRDLRIHRLLEGARGRQAPDLDSLVEAACNLSHVAAVFPGIAVDVNPVIVHSSGCVAVDALIVSPVEPTQTGTKE